MAGIKLNAPFELGAAVPVDTRLTLSKAEMLTVNDNVWPDKYLTVCSDDGAIYLYDKTNEMDVETGKFRLLSTDLSACIEKVSVMPEATVDNLNKVVMYIGETTVVEPIYVHGHFYECKLNGDYEWLPIDTEIDSYDNIENRPLILHRSEILINDDNIASEGESTPAKTYSDVVLEEGKAYLITIGAESPVEYIARNNGGTDVYLGDQSNNWWLTYDETNGTRVYNNTGSEIGLLKVETKASVEVNPDYEDFFKTIGAESKLSEDVTANVAVGGIAEGQTLSQNMAFTDVIKALLIKYFAPTLSIAFSGSLLNKKGSTIAAGATITATSVKTSENILSTKILDSEDLTLKEGTTAEGEALVYTTIANITTDTIFKASVSDGKSTVNKTLTIEFIDPFYAGISATNTLKQTDIEAMTEILEKKGNKTRAYTANNEYLVIAYPTSYGDLTAIIDQNNFDNTGAWTKQTVIFNESEETEVSYNVYITNDKITCSNFKYTFKF